jgi:hypothetical protein
VWPTAPGAQIAQRDARQLVVLEAAQRRADAPACRAAQGDVEPAGVRLAAARTGEVILRQLHHPLRVADQEGCEERRRPAQRDDQRRDARAARLPR